MVTAIFAGLAPAVLAIVGQAVWRIGKRALRNRVLIGIAVGAFVSLFVLEVAFPIVVAAAAVGYAAGRFQPALFAPRASAPPGAARAPLIADDALHGAPASLARAARIVVVGLVLWATPVVAAAAVFGRSHVFVEQGLFFSGTAVVTFGGAYAVLSFVAQRAVSVYHWLLPGEMVNGLALAETTPGPLNMVVQIHTLFATTRRHDWGPVHITGPVCSTLSLRGVFVTLLAFLLAFLLVFRYQLSVLRVLGICAAVGAAIHLATR